MDAITPGLVLAPLDSARVVSTVYSLSLATLVPFVGAAAAALAVRNMPAGTRVLVWRAAVVALLLMALAQLVPLRWEAWVLPAVLADPLVALGRHAVRTGVAAGDVRTLYFEAGAPTPALVIALLGAAYAVGVAFVLASLLRGVLAARRLVATASPLDDPAWTAAGVDVRRALGIRRTVPILVSTHCGMPMVAGVIRPAILIPQELIAISMGERRAVLLHEMAHVRSADVAYALAARVACALFWFHPATWWVARGLQRESELACDDRVLANGIRQSDYASLLASIADKLQRRLAAPSSPRAANAGPAVTPALTGDGDLRARLSAIVSLDLDRRAPRAASVVLSLLTAAAMALPLGVMKLEPTRDVLRSLMVDRRWESRAWAALGLAPRSDSLAVTRQAAASDPNPHVRAWASYALARRAPAHPAADAGMTTLHR